MTEQVSPTTATLSAQTLTLVSREVRLRQEAVNRAQNASRSAARASRQTQTEVVKKEQNRLSERVDQLVQSKKALSSRISTTAVSPPQRTVLLSRANDLQRQVDQLDGIIGGEGQGEQSKAVSVMPQVRGATAFSSGLIRPSLTQQQPASGALRAFAKNSSASAITLPALNAAAQSASNLDLLA